MYVTMSEPKLSFGFGWLNTSITKFCLGKCGTSFARMFALATEQRLRDELHDVLVDAFRTTMSS